MESVGKNHTGYNSDSVRDYLKRMSRDTLQRHKAQRYLGIVARAAEHSGFPGLCNYGAGAVLGAQEKKIPPFLSHIPPPFFSLGEKERSLGNM